MSTIDVYQIRCAIATLVCAVQCGGRLDLGGVRRVDTAVTMLSDLRHTNKSGRCVGEAIERLLSKAGDPDGTRTVAAINELAQLTAASQGITRNMPPGISPPFMLRLNATDVPILQLGVSSPSRTESELSDLGTNFIRLPLATVHGVTVTPARPVSRRTAPPADVAPSAARGSRAQPAVFERHCTVRLRAAAGQANADGARLGVVAGVQEPDRAGHAGSAGGRPARARVEPGLGLRDDHLCRTGTA